MLSEVKPDVVMLEEAGEILESHTLMAMTPETKQLILIGDHMQLRPKVESYRLREEGRQGFKFDVSLFERLVLSKQVPMVQLNVQHRMRPSISRFVRELTYPTLEDHPSTRGRKSVYGVARDVLFLEHEYMERADAESATLGSNSKVNEYEAAMAARIAKHFVIQGKERAESIGMLSPCLGSPHSTPPYPICAM
jgi:superfamily I DNA and/or RNA helicase